MRTGAFRAHVANKSVVQAHCTSWIAVLALLDLMLVHAQM